MAAAIVIVASLVGAIYFRVQSPPQTTNVTTSSIPSTITSGAPTTTTSASTTQVLQRDYRGSLEAGGRVRWYLVHIPASYDGKHATPLLLVFHGAGQGALIIQEDSNLNSVSEKTGFIVVYPNAINQSSYSDTGGFWANGSGNSADLKGVDDVAFVSALIDKMAKELNVDMGKVYAAGFSNGASFTLRLACELSDRVAGVAAVASTLPEKVAATCNPKKLVPILLIHGTADDTVPLAGYGPGFLSFPDTISKWVGINGCATSPVVSYAPHKEDRSMKVREEVYSPCKGNTKVAFYSVEGMQHVWPTAEFTDIEGGQAIWDFFQSNSS